MLVSQRQSFAYGVRQIFNIVFKVDDVYAESYDKVESSDDGIYYGLHVFQGYQPESSFSRFVFSISCSGFLSFLTFAANLFLFFSFNPFYYFLLWETRFNSDFLVQILCFFRNIYYHCIMCLFWQVNNRFGYRLELLLLILINNYLV